MLLSAERILTFEPDRVSRTVEASGSEFVLLFVHGPGGIGKTALLESFVDIAEEAGANPVRLDLRAVDPSPPAFTAALGQALGLGEGVDPLAAIDEEDAEVSAALARVLGLLEPPSHLMRPRILRRVLGGHRDGSPLWPGKPLRTPLRRRTLRAGGIATPLREAGRADASEAAVFVHGVPGSGALERLASVTLLCTGVPIDYRWHRTARIWRTPLAGELSMATLTRAGFRASSRRAGPRRLPGPFVDRMFEDLDARTRKAILQLYRSVGNLDELAAEAVAALRPLDPPALVIWGKHDPFLPAALGERQRQAFPGTEVHVLGGNGHWPFVDRADRVEELLVDFLARTHSLATGRHDSMVSV